MKSERSFDLTKDCTIVSAAPYLDEVVIHKGDKLYCVSLTGVKGNVEKVVSDEILPKPEVMPEILKRMMG